MRTSSVLGLLAVAVVGVVVYRKLTAAKPGTAVARAPAPSPAKPATPADMMAQWMLAKTPGYNGIPYGTPVFVNGKWSQPQ